MELKINVDIDKGFCDVEVKGLNLKYVKNLTTIAYAVADEYKKCLILYGIKQEIAEKAKKLLLTIPKDGDIQRILEVASQGYENMFD